MSGAWPWVVIALLGAYHGLDPSMGWLFAVALGLQEKSRRRVIWSLFPIALGHFISIAVVVALVAEVMARWAWVLRPVGASALILFGAFRILRPHAHPRWVAMRVGAVDLTVWSFLMATAHGAGLMLFPILIQMPHAEPMPMMMHNHRHPMPAVVGGALGLAESLAVVVLHTSAMFTTMGIIAIAVYEWIGLQILRSAWINLDTLWAGALIAAGVLCFVV